MNAGRELFKRSQIRSENMVYRPAGQHMLNTRAGPARNVKAPET